MAILSIVNDESIKHVPKPSWYSGAVASLAGLQIESLSVTIHDPCPIRQIMYATNTIWRSRTLPLRHFFAAQKAAEKLDGYVPSQTPESQNLEEFIASLPEGLHLGEYPFGPLIVSSSSP